MSSVNPRNEPEAAGGGAERASQRERDLAVALAAYVDRSSREEEVDIDEFCKRIPELAKELRPLLELERGAWAACCWGSTNGWGGRWRSRR